MRSTIKIIMKGGRIGMNTDTRKPWITIKSSRKEALLAELTELEIKKRELLVAGNCW